jgi:flagellar basal-body rod protein FlgF
MIQSLSSGMQAQWYRHEVLANDLANVSTAGFKQDSLILKQGTIEAGPGGTIAAGAHSISQWTDFSQVALHETERPLDVALSGSGFFVVQTPAGPRYTRAGALSVNAQGNLVSAGGFQVLGVGGPISVRSSKIAIGPQGDVQDDGQSVDTLRVVDFPKPYALIKESRGLFVPADVKVAPEAATDYQVVGGALEESNLNAVRTMVEMIDMLRKYETAQRAIRAEDDAARFASNDIGRLQ